MALGEEAGGVRRFWGGLGLPGLIDVHTHFMPERAHLTCTSSTPWNGWDSDRTGCGPYATTTRRPCSACSTVKPTGTRCGL